ncbi:LacI family DNA-binding transcriptional regulator [Diplocloster modestus]|uniref:LacI family transcriptional regulator n=1 Tax=Diplocloster modestus TaxID=2850322 RepID=A0ABS6KDJ0_9FIRM|nr:LacI family DNA-binding transcriptional regulator [Diplocloster modestus]MBU9728585.1 LacI family transcriptional regulator [Diplocloster modestus]
MKPTIRDVANRAGVSVATVSRYLNNSSLIAPVSRDKVRTAIDALNYRPNMMARGLVKQNTETIALVVDYSHEEIYGNEFFLKIQVGLEREFSRHGYYLMLVNIASAGEAPGLIKKIILEGRVDGIVLLNEMAEPSVIHLLNEMEVPFVIAGRGEYKNAAWVDIDNILGGYVAANKLIGCGLEKIGFITNSFQKRFVKERFEGFQKAMMEAGLEYAETWVAAGLNTYQDQIKFLKECEKPVCDAYVVSDSYIAYHFIKALKNSGYSVPKDVQIVAFDNQLLSEVSEPGITVVDIDVTMLGVHAARFLLDNLYRLDKNYEPQARHELLGVRLIERGSTL